MAETNLDEYQDVEALFRQLHVGEIDRVVKRLEYSQPLCGAHVDRLERKQLHRDLSNLVGSRQIDGRV